MKKRTWSARSAAAAISAVVLAGTCTMPVYASSLFSDQVQQIEQQKSDAAYPSYAIFALVPADSITEDEENGSITYEYQRVDLKGFEDFGTYLSEEEFYVADSYVKNNVYVYDLAKALDSALIDGQPTTDEETLDKEFVLYYDVDREVLQCVYTIGTTVQYPDFINDYTYTSNSDRVRADEDTTDRYGNTYAHSLTLDNAEAKSISFLVEKKYTVFAGIVAAPDTVAADGSWGAISVYADDELIYESGECYTTSIPRKFSIDITGCTDLRIQWSDSWYGDHSRWATIFNGVFY